MNHNLGKPYKSLILSAGFGSRLRPLTETVPKPLVTVCNVPLLNAAMRRCVLAGFTDIAVNTHHLGDVLANHARSVSKSLGVQNLTISSEQPEILGTGGALSALAQWWGDTPLLVYNGDILSNIQISALVAKHLDSNNVVTMVILEKPPQDGGRSVWVDKDGSVQAIAKPEELSGSLQRTSLRQTGYACAYLANPLLKQYLPKNPAFYDVVKSFQDLLADGHPMGTLLHEGFWADVGTPESLWATNLAVANLPTSVRTDIFLDLLRQDQQSVKSLNYDVDAVSVIDPTASLGAGSKITESVILSKATVKPGESIHRTLRGENFSVEFPSSAQTSPE